MTPVPRPDYRRLHSRLQRAGHLEAASPFRLYMLNLYVTASLARVAALVLERNLK